MTTAARARTVLLAAAALLALAPLAAAHTGALVADTLSFASPAMESGSQPMVSFADVAAADDGVGAAPQSSLDIQAGAAQAISYHTASIRQPSLTDLNDSTQPAQREQVDLSGGHLRLDQLDRGFVLHVYSLGGALAAQVRTDAGQVNTFTDLTLGQGGLDHKSPQDGTPAGAHPDFPNFAAVDAAGPMVAQHQMAAHTSIRLSGDMVVELTGASLHAQDASHDTTVDGRSWSEPLQPGLPPASEAAAYRQHSGFVRLFLSAATLEFSSSGGSPRVEVAFPAIDADVAGPVTFTAAKGQVAQGSHAVDVDGPYVLDGPSVLHLAPQDKALSAGIAAPAPRPQGTIASVPAPASAALIGTGAILALACAVGVGLLRKVLRLPALKDVEQAIEEGEYRRAARMAARILARLPGSEDALLGRAVALSKSGEPQRVVDELAPRLAARPPSDGALHFVLGLAQIEVGRERDGQASLREAVRLTPSLHAEVAPRLGKAFSPSPPTKETPHGYA